MNQEMKREAPELHGDSKTQGDVKGRDVTNKKQRRGKGRPQRNNSNPSTTPEKGKNLHLGEPGNDFSWWAKEDVLLRDSANYKCNYIAGTAIAGNDIPYVVPGVLSVVLAPVYGNSKFSTDPLNIWARDLYLRMFQKYRGITSYSASDLGITLIAGNEIVKLIAQYERIYGVINRYSKLNVNMPFAEVYALGLNASIADTLRGRLSDFRYDLNYLIKKAQRLCILKDMSIVADDISLFGYEYLDHESARSQIILFRQATYGVYSDTNLTSGGSITFFDLSSTVLFDFTADNMCYALEQAINALVGSDSVQKIYGDLVVWFGEEAMLTFAPVPEDYLVVPVYEESILHKLHNAESVHGSSGNTYVTSVVDPNMAAADVAFLQDDDYHIYQNNDTIVTAASISDVASGAWVTVGGYSYRFSSGVDIIAQAHVLDTYRADAVPETIVEGVLFKFTTSVLVSGGNAALPIDSCCFYIPKAFTLWTQTNGTAVGQPYNIVSSSNASAMAAAGGLACIDWAPLSYYVVSGVITGIYGDVDNVIPLYGNDLSRLHRTIVLSGIKTDVKVIPASK